MLNGVPLFRTGAVRGKGVREPWLLIAGLAGILSAGCEYAFEPFIENKEAGFSMFGFLDLYADTQFIRVAPVRLNSLLGPEPIDAIVTLEHLGTGKVVTLSDSLVAYEDRFDDFEGVGYAHNFWTTERLEPLARYRLKAVRSDGAATTVTVSMPELMEFTLENNLAIARASPGALAIQAERVLFADLMAVDSSGVRFPVVPQRKLTTTSNLHRYAIDAFSFGGPGGIEVRVTTVLPGWPFHPELSDLSVSLQGRVTTNVENGYGFVEGVAVRTIHYHRCDVVVPKPIGRTCLFVYDTQSASVSGRIIRQPCGMPHQFESVALIERFSGGGAAIRHQVTGKDGEFEFQGIEPGTELVLQVRPWSVLHDYLGPLTVPLMTLPQAVAGRTHSVPEISVLIPDTNARVGCI